MMNRALFLLLAICTLTAAMVPRYRRAINLEEKKPIVKNATSLFCAHSTPCAWAVYKPQVKIVEQYVKNSYCDCEPGLTCLQNEDDDSASTYIYHCRSKNVTEAPET